MLLSMENRLVYFPEPDRLEEWQQFDVADMEHAQLEAADGTRLHGLWFAAVEPRMTVVFFHGNAGNVCHRAQRLGMIRDRYRVNLFAVDYRGYGRSEGQPNEAGVDLDAEAASLWAAQRAGVEPRELVFMGRSLGGALAVKQAAAHQASGLILESTFSALPDVAAVHYPWLPVRWLMRNRYDSLTTIEEYRGPLLQSHGVQDRVIPIVLGRKLFAAHKGPQQWIEFQDLGHNNGPSSGYYDQLGAFLDTLTMPREKIDSRG